MIERVSIIDAVVDEVRGLVTSGSYKPGQKLPTEKEICEKLKVGRSTVREAFRVLQASGYVEMRPGKGAFVANYAEEGTDSAVKWFSVNKPQLLEFMEVRLAIEPLALKLAIERADRDEIRRLEETHMRFKEALAENDGPLLSMLDEEFHTQIIKATRNQLLISINKNINRAFSEYRAKAFSMPDIVDHALGPHGEILSAIMSRNIVSGQRAMIKHIYMALEDIEWVGSGKRQ